jgi:hypothetical protein
MRRSGSKPFHLTLLFEQPYCLIISLTRRPDGLPASIDEIYQIAGERELHVIEDIAQALDQQAEDAGGVYPQVMSASVI